MGIREVIQLTSAVIEIEERNGYLFLVESGQLVSVREVGAYANALQALIMKTNIHRAVIDSRGEVGDPPPEVRAAMWDWLCATDRGFAKVAFVLASEMAIARVNMTALSRRAPVRAFDNIQTATRWLMRETRRASTLSMATVNEESGPARSDVPASREEGTRRRSAIRPTPGFRPPAPGPIEDASSPRRSKEG